MKFSAAIVSQNRHEFAVVLVRRKVIGDEDLAAKVVLLCSTVLGCKKMVLLAQDSAGRFAFHGPRALVKRLRREESVGMHWKHYTLPN